MSQLAQIRQHVKTIETIKKITHAMRLISMSTHSQLKHKEQPLELYNETLHLLLHKLTQAHPQWKSPILQPKETELEKHLVILIGSQKGLCGNFNSTLFSAFKGTESLISSTTDYIVIGKKAVDFMHVFTKSNPGTIINAFPTFTNKTRLHIANNIVRHITHEQKPYTRVSVISNKLKTFFVQQPMVTTLVPLDYTTTNAAAGSFSDYSWEQNPERILEHVSRLYLTSKVEHILFQSLFAEHAARFVSMDTATRNAESILDITKLKYNKLRQAEITKELAELTGSNL